jgi:hypothetical protein
MQIYPLSTNAEKYLAEARNILAKAMQNRKNLNKEHHYESRVLNGILFKCICTPNQNKVYIYAEDYIFATHPTEFHKDNPYPLDNTRRGLVSEDLTYETLPEGDLFNTGNVYWHGKGTVLSWRGSPGFNIEAPKDEGDFGDSLSQDLQNNDGLSFYYTAFGSEVYENGDVIWTAPEGVFVLGACYNEERLIVICRAFDGTNFILVEYIDGEIGTTLKVGRFNNIWSFKSDGSHGVSYYDGLDYSWSIGSFSSSNPTENTLNIIVTTNTSLDKEAEPLPVIPSDCNGFYEMGTLPARYAELDAPCKAAWDAREAYIGHTTTGRELGISGSGTILKVGKAYNRNDEIVDLTIDINVSLSHKYQTDTYSKPTSILVSEGERSGPQCNFPDNIEVGDIITCTFCGDNMSWESAGEVPMLGMTEISKGVYEITSVPCEWGQVAIDCGCGQTGYSGQRLPATVSVSIPNPVVVNSIITASGGYAPYTFNTPNMTYTQLSDTQIKITGISCGTSGVSAAYVNVKVTDICNNETTQRAYFNGAWVELAGETITIDCNSGYTSEGSQTANAWVFGGVTYSSLPDGPWVTGTGSGKRYLGQRWQGITYPDCAANNCNAVAQASILWPMSWTGTVGWADGWYCNYRTPTDWRWFTGAFKERTKNIEWRC